MPDISKCKGGNCPLAFNCYRFTAKANPYRQSYFAEVPWDEEKKECNYYLPNEKIKVKSDDK
jgi:hypothetical protein